MTHFLYRSQQSAPSELLKGSHRFRKRCGLRGSRSQLSGPTDITHKIAVTAYLATSDDSSLVNISRIVWLPLQPGFLTQSTVSTLSTFSRLTDFSANPSAFPSLACTTKFGMDLASETGAMLRIDCEAVMWKITTRNFTLEEVLIKAAINLSTSADTAAKRERRASQKSKGDQA
jgi:hypothetical protein